jgi:hypothetical protein
VPGLFSESQPYLPTPPVSKSQQQAPEPISESDLSPSRPHGKGHAREAVANPLPAPASPDLTPADPASDRRLRLNIGGVVFETLQSTLCKYPDSLLGSMFHPRNHALLKPDHRGEFFFDRNPKPFEVILDFYRTGALIVPAAIPKKLLKKELQFWQLSVSTDGKPKKKDELEDLCRLILDHVSRSAASAEATRDLIISKKEQFKDGDDILVVSQYGWSFKRKNDSTSIAAFGCKTVVDPKFYALCEKQANQHKLLSRLRADGIRATISPMQFERCHLEHLPLVLKLQSNNSPSLLGSPLRLRSSSNRALKD